MSITANLHSAARDHPTGKALTIGNFDGCHLGHRRLIEQTSVTSRQHGLLSSVLTFDPSPAEYFQNSSPAASRLFSADQKLRALKECGADLIISEPFNEFIATMSHEEFYHGLLRHKLNVQQLIVGYDFCFGKDRLGSTSYLAEICRETGVGFEQAESVFHRERPVSSTRIREALQAGGVREAREMLGRPYLIEGSVKQGDKKGRENGFPTANLGRCAQLLPAHGVYAGFASFDPEPSILSLPRNLHPCVLNIGLRPTLFGNDPVQVEAHCFALRAGPDELYGRPLALYLVERIRPEKKFDGLGALRSAIAADIEIARQLLARESFR